MTIAQGIFRQYDIRGVVGEDLTEEAAVAIGQAYAALLDERGISGPVAVGRDNRPSGTALRAALVTGLTTRGRDVIDIGVGPTPLLYWSLHHLTVAGGIQITGSHNPPEFNGFKICIGTGSLHGDGIQRLRELLGAPATAHTGTVSSVDLNAAYADDIVTRTGPLPRRLKVVFDAGNGAGGPLTEAIFARMNIDATYLFCESDGTFPNHHPDPTVEENLVDLIAAVQAHGADIGIAFDGDADRIGIVDAAGTIIWGDYLLLLYARDVFARTGGNQAIIFDVKCSQALPDAITKAGGIPVIKALTEGLAGNRIRRVMGVMNGTCNYILTRMQSAGLPYAEVFEEARQLGYLEADPTLDVGGIDAGHKLSLLAAIAFGTRVSFDAVELEGIGNVSIDDIRLAEDMGYRIKLLGVAQMTGRGLEQRMTPCLVPSASPLGQLQGGTNMVVLEGDSVGQIVLRGPGAGQGPTASAVMADVIDIARGLRLPTFGIPASQLAVPTPASTSTGTFAPSTIRRMVTRF